MTLPAKLIVRFVYFLKPAGGRVKFAVATTGVSIVAPSSLTRVTDEERTIDLPTAIRSTAIRSIVAPSSVTRL